MAPTFASCVYIKMRLDLLWKQIIINFTIALLYWITVIDIIMKPQYSCHVTLAMFLFSTRDSLYFPCCMDWSWVMKRSRGMKRLGAPIAESDLGFGSWGFPPNTATLRPPQVPQNLWTFFFYPMAGMELPPPSASFFLSSTHPFSGNENKYSKAYHKKLLKSYLPEGFDSSKRKGCFARLLTLNELSLILPPTHWGPHQLDT